MTKIRTLAFGTAALGTAALAYGAFVEARWFRVRHEELRLLPAGAEPVRVLHISDIHLMPHDTAKLRWLAQLAELKPDLIVNTGDNIGSAESIQVLTAALSEILGVPGVFVPGSNDYYAPKPLVNPLKYFMGPSAARERRDDVGELLRRQLPHQRLFRSFTDAGWLNLTDSTGEITVNGTPFSFAGTDDPHLGFDHWPGFTHPAAPSLTAGRHQSPVRIGVTHAPYRAVLDAMSDDGADLIFAGHTHGGQICLPFYGALVTNSDLPTRYASGLHQWGSAALNVSAGIGAAPAAPVRIACRPEAIVIDLLAR